MIACFLFYSPWFTPSLMLVSKIWLIAFNLFRMLLTTYLSYLTHFIKFLAVLVTVVTLLGYNTVAKLFGHKMLVTSNTSFTIVFKTLNLFPLGIPIIIIK